MWSTIAASWSSLTGCCQVEKKARRIKAKTVVFIIYIALSSIFLMSWILSLTLMSDSDAWISPCWHFSTLHQSPWHHQELQGLVGVVCSRPGDVRTSSGHSFVGHSGLAKWGQLLASWKTHANRKRKNIHPLSIGLLERQSEAQTHQKASHSDGKALTKHAAMCLTQQGTPRKQLGMV